MNILIINQPPFNRGDESAHKGLVRSLLSNVPNAKIKILSKWQLAESIRRYKVIDDRVSYIYEPLEYFKLYKVKQAGLKKGYHFLWKIHPLMLFYKNSYQWSDIVICAPGGICMGGFQDWDHLFLLHLAKFYKKPLVYYGRSFGPFPTETEENRLFKSLSIDIIKYFSFFSIRDRKSEQLAKELAFPFESTVDSAFLDSPQADIPYELSYLIKNKNYMVFVPNYLLWHYAYKGKFTHDTLLNFYAKLVSVIWEFNPELNIVMLPQLFGRDEQYPLSDLHFFRDLATIINDSRIMITSDSYSSDIQQSIIAKAKFVIGARYHSIVFAINQGVPFISLSYEHKMTGLLESLGKTEWCVDFTHSLESSKGQEDALNNVREILPQLTPDLGIQKKAKEIASDCFKKLLKNQLLKYE